MIANDRRAEGGHTFWLAKTSIKHAQLWSKIRKKNMVDIEEEILLLANLFFLGFNRLRQRPFPVLMLPNFASDSTTNGLHQNSRRFVPSYWLFVLVFKFLAVAILKTFIPRLHCMSSILTLIMSSNPSKMFAKKCCDMKQTSVESVGIHFNWRS